VGRVRGWRTAARRLANEVHGRAAARALVAAAPFLALALARGDQVFFNTALVAISTLIASERASLTSLGVLLHGAAILAGFALLFFALPVAPLFVVACAAFAAASIWLGRDDPALRSLGNWTFIPALYLACEIGEGLAHDALVATASARLPLLALGVVPVLLLTSLDTLRERDARGWTRLRRRHAPAAAEPPAVGAGEAMVAVAAAVGAAAAFVELSQIPHAQWAIWSAASVVTGDVASSRVKLRDRLAGAALGVPAGIALGFVVPHDPLVFALASFGAMLTLVSFRRYAVAFGLRCMLIALALLVASGSPGIAAERAVNVAIGGAFGIVAVLCVHELARRGAARRATAAAPRRSAPRS